MENSTFALSSHVGRSVLQGVKRFEIKEVKEGLETSAQCKLYTVALYPDRLIFAVQSTTYHSIRSPQRRRFVCVGNCSPLARISLVLSHFGFSGKTPSRQSSSVQENNAQMKKQEGACFVFCLGYPFALVFNLGELVSMGVSLVMAGVCTGLVQRS